jgi:hypothetical protein
MLSLLGYSSVEIEDMLRSTKRPGVPENQKNPAMKKAKTGRL